MNLRRRLDDGANRLARVCAHPYAVAGSIVLSLAWLAGAPFLWSTGYVAVMSTTTAIVPFVLLFVVLSAGLRDVLAIQVKLDELIRTKKAARNELIAAEDMATEDIQLEAERLRHDDV